MAISNSIPSPSFFDFPKEYSKEFSISTRLAGIVGVVLGVITITGCVLALSGLLTPQLPQQCLHVFTHVNVTRLVIGVSVSAILALGAYGVIYRARHQKEPLLDNQTIFQSRDYTAHITEIICTFDQSQQSFPAYVDTSTTLKGKSGKAYIYSIKPPQDHYTVSTLVTASIPFYAVATIAYHIIRMCVVPFYVLSCWSIERFRATPLFHGQRKFQLIDIVLEPAKSVLHSVKAPFYASAFLAATLYSFVNPMGGRVLGAKIERDWNDGAHRPHGLWLAQIPWGTGLGNLWARWGELGPAKLGCMKVFVAGCWQPIGVAELDENGEISSGISIGKAFNSRVGSKYRVTTRQARQGSLVDAELS